MNMTEAERAANVEKAIDRWRRATSTPAGISHEPVVHQHEHAAPEGAAAQNALTRGLQAALASEGALSRRSKF